MSVMLSLFGVAILIGGLPETRVFGRFELGRTSIGQIASSCGVGAAALRREAGESGSVFLVSKLPGDGCVVWRSGPLGSWSTLTAIELFDNANPLCRSALPCSLESRRLSEELRECRPEQFGSGLTPDSNGGRFERTKTVEYRRPAGTWYELSGVEVLFHRRGARRGTCASLKRFVVVEVDWSATPGMPIP